MTILPTRTESRGGKRDLVPLNLSLIAEREVEKLGMGAPPELLEAIGLQRSAR